MRTVIDLQCLQTTSMNRGIGRYAKAFVKGYLKRSKLSGDECVLLFNTSPFSKELIRYEEELIEERLDHTIAYVPQIERDWAFCETNYTFNQSLKYLRAGFIQALEPDLYIVTSLFEFNAFVSIPRPENRSFSVGMILYDLIPLENPEHYLSSERLRNWYVDRIDELRAADFFLCISKYTKNVARRVLEIEDERLFNIGGSSSLLENIDYRKSSSLQPGFDIKKNKFILYVGGFDKRKNVDKIIRVYKRLDRKIRRNHMLVLAGSIDEVQKNQLVANAGGMRCRPGKVVFLNYVTDEHLAWLYSNCALFVFPSSHEGLGLPPIEAMAFGAPVIVSDRTSLPELAPTNGAIVDPDDIEAFTKKVEEVLYSIRAQTKLADAGRKRVKSLSWDSTTTLGYEIGRRLFERNRDSKRNYDAQQDRETFLDNLTVFLNDRDDIETMIRTYEKMSREVRRLFKKGILGGISKEFDMTNGFNEGVPRYSELSRPYVFSSGLCRQQHFHLPLYTYWCNRIKETPRYHRKQWEYVYICQVLYERGFLSEGRTAIGFGVGKEPLSALFAAEGVEVLATDLETKEAERLGWVSTDQHSDSLAFLNERRICDDNLFRKLVSFRHVDMKNIPIDIGPYDFCWSSCAFEHLGSIENGILFVLDSLRLLKPGGLAVHTTEFNVSSNLDTIDNNENFVIYRRRDIEELVNRLQRENCTVETIDFTKGNDELERYVDLPPYSEEPHLRLELGEEFVSTSIGLIVRKNGDNLASGKIPSSNRK